MAIGKEERRMTRVNDWGEGIGGKEMVCGIFVIKSLIDYDSSKK